MNIKDIVDFRNLTNQRFELEMKDGTKKIISGNDPRLGDICDHIAHQDIKAREDFMKNAK